MHKLRGLGVVQSKVLLVTHRLREVLVDQLAQISPLVAVLHKQQVVTIGDEFADIRHGSVAVQAALLVK